MQPISEGLGGCTLATIAAPPSAALASETMVAPAAS
jgi:hypothetical protein